MPQQSPQLDVNANAVRSCDTSALPCITSQSQENLTFTNTHNEDLDVLYDAIEHDEDDVDLAQAYL